MPVFIEITAPVRANFRLTGNFERTVSNILVRIEASESGEVSKISLVKETTSDQVPTITVSGAHCRVEEPRSGDVIILEERLAAIEGMLSAVGLDYIDFSRVGRRWFEAEDPSKSGEHLFGYSTDHEKRPTTPRILSSDFLEPLLRIATNGDKDNECLAQRFFKLGWSHFCNFRYVDSIHDLCFFIELSFADGKIKSVDQANAAAGSALFKKALEGVRLEIEHEVKRGDISIKDAKRLLIDVEPLQFAKWIFSIRGNFLHQSSKRTKTWHPSNATEHKLTATILAVFCTVAALEMHGNTIPDM